jgi:hypothetical protein
MPLAQTQWTGLVNMPVGSPTFGLGFGSTAGAIANQGSIDLDAAFATDGHATESQLNAGLTKPIQHETVIKIAGHETVESEVGNNGALVDNDSIIGISDLDFGLQSDRAST